MTTYTNVKQIGCLILLATALLVGVGGCGIPMQWKVSSGGTSMEVDGVQYGVNWYTRLVRQGQINVSFITLCHSTPQNLNAISTECSFFGDAFSRRFYDALYIGDTGIDAQTETLYFIKDNKIVFDKKYQELGIDVSRMGGQHDEVLNYLRPILESIIREHVQPQEPEMEEQL